MKTTLLSALSLALLLAGCGLMVATSDGIDEATAVRHAKERSRGADQLSGSPELITLAVAKSKYGISSADYADHEQLFVVKLLGEYVASGPAGGGQSGSGTTNQEVLAFVMKKDGKVIGLITK